MLDAGFTSCFSAAAAKPRLDIVLRNAIDSGDFPGPRTLAASPEMTVAAGLGDVRLLHMYRENFAVVWVALALPKVTVPGPLTLVQL